jgi:hypothetical protein
MGPFHRHNIRNAMVLFDQLTAECQNNVLIAVKMPGLDTRGFKRMHEVLLKGELTAKDTRS